jgi:purine-cytosine permease-like protein
VFVSCVVLESVGAASATIGGAALGDPTGAFTGHLPTAVADLTLLAIALGAVAANVLNIYSGALSFLAMGIRLPVAARRAMAALGFGAIGFVVAVFGLHDAGAKYESFLLVIAYWIGPWLAVVLTDQLLRRGATAGRLAFDSRHRNWPGPVSMVIGIAVSVWLFSNQTRYVGPVPRHFPSVGDLTFEVGFVLTAVLYVALTALRHRPKVG